jgi:hypothetical protein
VGTKIIIGDTIDRGVDKRNECYKSQPSRKMKVKIGKESRAAAGISEVGCELGHREQAPLRLTTAES